MRSGKFGFLFGTSALLGPMTAAERAKGRYMRAPDHAGDPFADLNAAGDVEGSFGDAGGDPAPTPPKKGGSGRPPKTKEAPAQGGAENGGEGGENGGNAGDAGGAEGDDDDDDQGGEGGEGGEGEGEGDGKPTKPKSAKDRIRELNNRFRQEQRDRLALEGRLAALEKGGLPSGNAGGNAGGNTDDLVAPDPTDATKYPLGHLDDRYIEDRLEYLAETKARKIADAALQRQQQTEQGRAAEQQRTELLGKVEQLSAKGSDLYDDFQETVVEAGMRGDWKLDQPTFEAAHEAEHGAQILYELSQDKAEAERVAKLSPFQQLRWVDKRNAEITAKRASRSKPGAGAPPQTQTRGANSRTQINPATDNLDDFEKAWAADAKR